MSRQTIFAARRVVPPLLVAPAARSNTSRKLIRPLEVPPPESFSCLPRMLLKFDPVPEPYLKRRASDLTRSKKPIRYSGTFLMKHAEHRGQSYAAAGSA